MKRVRSTDKSKGPSAEPPAKQAASAATAAKIPVDHAKLTEFVTRVFVACDVNEGDAKIAADNLVCADLRGIDSHGVARLRRYVEGIRDGIMITKPDEKVVTDTPTTCLIDAGAGLGQPVSHRAMKMAIEKAKQYGCGIVTVRNSNHYGIAGYYSMMALDEEEGIIGISMTNADVLVVPTFGRDAMLGTNPISVAVPSNKERPFVLDMATSTVPRGKLEVYNRSEKPLPLGWATDAAGVSTTDAGDVLENFKQRLGGGLLPLGGAGELLSGHKGFGLALLVDILCGVLPGAGYANTIYPKDADGKKLPANIGHFFMAIKIPGFRSFDLFKDNMDDIIKRLRESPKAEGQDRIYIHGEKEFEQRDVRSRDGIPLMRKVYDDLKAIASETEVEFDI